MGALHGSDAVERFCRAAEINDVDGMLAQCAATAELIPPISSKMVIAGHDDLRLLLGAVFGSIRNLRVRQILADGDTRVSVFDATFAGLYLTDAMVIDCDDAGQIRRITPHIRPLLPLVLVSIATAPKILRYPRMILRSRRLPAELAH